MGIGKALAGKQPVAPEDEGDVGVTKDWIPAFAGMTEGVKMLPAWMRVGI